MDFETVFRGMDNPGWRDLLEAYLQEGKDIDQRHPLSGWTLLHVAAEIQNYEALKFLLDRGASPNTQDFDGTTPLMQMVDSETQAKVQAGWEINLEAVEMLLIAGADPTTANERGSTPVWLAHFMDGDLECLLSKYVPSADN